MKTDSSKPPSHTFPINDIVVGKRHRHDLGDIVDLARTIEEVGLLHPIPITPDGTLIAGARRLAACVHLGWENIPVHVIPLQDIVRGEFAENAYRKGFLPSEIYEIWRALEPAEKAAAEARQKATRFGGNGDGNGAGNLPAPSHSKGRVRDTVAKFAGASGRTLEKIRAVIDAAECDPVRFGPLVKQMDQDDSVHAAYSILKAMRASDKELPAAGTTAEASTIQISVDAYNEAFPQYPKLIEDKGLVVGTWLCGSSWHKSQLYGKYPPNFLPRALALFPGVKQIVHCPSGTVTHPGLTIDLIRDRVRRPQIVADAADIPLADSCTDLCLSDPPYTKEDAKIYGTDPFPLKKFMREATRILRVGGYLGILHTHWPCCNANELKPVAMIGVVTGPCRMVRMFFVF
jgi:ParB-like nuclease domain